MGTFIDFIESMPRNELLTREFQKILKNYSIDELSDWFNTNGYKISGAECSIILKNTKAKYLAAAAMLPY